MKATVAKFKYDKRDGTIPKQRKLLVLSKPSDTFFGVEYDDDIEIAGLLDYLVEKEKMEEYLKHKYGLETLKYKRFKEEKVFALTEEKITL